jgi:hypothetical protein
MTVTRKLVQRIFQIQTNQIHVFGFIPLFALARPFNLLFEISKHYCSRVFFTSYHRVNHFNLMPWQLWGILVLG